MLEANGYHEAAPEEAADLCIVNTCTVTAEADAKGRQLVRRLAHENPHAAIVVMWPRGASGRRRKGRGFQAAQADAKVARQFVEAFE